ncbi:PREDICTED: uncharacterized protein LOC108569423 [Nicrophorus vespilloides]|uniref:Uncharacterized protein LOC108569423 n=1 Tax=Nicrophorus vespilloides TaxID=110193 RepID=A0ABM1NI08_NICVS|nr:PREDICTED: uncharacterized protein LOC108569423 [Nicrophorus vespilloides]
MDVEGGLSTSNKFVEQLSVSILSNTIEELSILKKLAYIEDILIETVQEISEKQTFNGIKQIIVKENKQNKEDNNLLQNVKSSVLTLADLKKQMRNSDDEWYIENKEKEEYLGNLKDEYENLIMEFKIKENYIWKWQSSQMEQARMKIKIQEDKLRESLQKDNDNIENELRVNLEILIYLTQVITIK